MAQLTPQELLDRVNDIWQSGISVTEARTSLLELVDAVDVRAKNDENHIYISPTQRISVWLDTGEDALSIQRYNATTDEWELGDIYCSHDSVNIGASKISQYGNSLAIKAPADVIGKVPVAKLDVDGIGSVISVKVGSSRNPNDIIQPVDTDTYAGTNMLAHLESTADSVYNSLRLKSGGTVPTKAVSIRVWKGWKTYSDIGNNPAEGLVFDEYIDDSNFGSSAIIVIDMAQRLELELNEPFTVNIKSTDSNPFSLLGDATVIDPMTTMPQFVPYFDVDRTIQQEIEFESTANLAHKDNVLELDNTVAFTPTADYHPATKAYVDAYSSADVSALTGIISVDTGDNAMTIVGELAVGSCETPQPSFFGNGGFKSDDVVFLHTDDNVTFSDITTLLHSNNGDVTNMFPTIHAGSTLYIGGECPIYGVNASIFVNGDMPNGSVVAEFWDGYNWIDVSYMAVTTAGDLIQYGNNLAVNSNENEDWYLNFDPREIYNEPEKVVVNGENKYWIRFRLVADIVTNPILDCLFVHPSSFAINDNGIVQYYGVSRRRKTVLSGLNNLVNNIAKSPVNQSVTYSTGLIVASYKDNQFNNNAFDSSVFMLNIDDGMDTSVPVEVELTWYVEGTETGNVDLRVDKLVVDEGFVYDGTATASARYSEITNVGTPADLTKQKTRILVDVSDAKYGDTIMMSISRDGRVVNTNDTLEANIVLTHVVVNSYFYK